MHQIAGLRVEHQGIQLCLHYHDGSLPIPQGGGALQPQRLHFGALDHMIFVVRIEFGPVRIQAPDAQTSDLIIDDLRDDDPARQPEALGLAVILEHIRQPPGRPGPDNAILPPFPRIETQPVPTGRCGIDAAGGQPGQMFLATLQTGLCPAHEISGTGPPRGHVHILGPRILHRLKTIFLRPLGQGGRLHSPGSRSHANARTGIGIGHLGVVTQELDAVPLGPAFPAPVVAPPLSTGGPDAAPLRPATGRAGRRPFAGSFFLGLEALFTEQIDDISRHKGPPKNILKCPARCPGHILLFFQRKKGNRTIGHEHRIDTRPMKKHFALAPP